jgi:hypothetical protein
MCDICNGASRDDVRRALARKVYTYGWAIQGVEAGRDSDPWAYTVGLVEHFRHPELIVTSVCLDEAGFVLNRLSEDIREGRRLAPGAVADVAGVEVSFVAVHPAHCAIDIFASWFDHYRSVGDDFLPLTALQVTFLGDHDPYLPRLDLPEPVLGLVPMNRAARRAHEPRRGHRRR